MAAAIQPRPSVPPPYVAGRVLLAANTVVSLLELVQRQLEPNCPGAAVEVALTADVNNPGSVYLGAHSYLAGPLTATNWGYELRPGDVRVYQSTYPGSSTPLGALQILATSQSWLHVEVQA